MNFRRAARVCMSVTWAIHWLTAVLFLVVGSGITTVVKWVRIRVSNSTRYTSSSIWLSLSVDTLNSQSTSGNPDDNVACSVTDHLTATEIFHNRSSCGELAVKVCNTSWLRFYQRLMIIYEFESWSCPHSTNCYSYLSWVVHVFTVNKNWLEGHSLGPVCSESIWEYDGELNTSSDNFVFLLHQSW